MKKKYLPFVLVAFAVTSALIYDKYYAHESKKDIVILQIAEHNALNITRSGIEDYLKQCCASMKLGYENAQASTDLALQIGRRISASPPSVVVAIGTIAAQSFLKSPHLPVVFSSITDPVSAGLLKDLDVPEHNFTGVSNATPLLPQLQYIVDILPQAKKIGVIYNNAEANSISILEHIKSAATQLNVEIVESVISSSNDIVNATQILVNKNIDAIFISNDNTALSAIYGITKTASTAKIPVFCSDTDTIHKGVLAAFGPDQYQIGVQTGRMVEDILVKGKKVHDLAVQFPTDIALKINLITANALGIAIDEDLINAASEVVR